MPRYSITQCPIACVLCTLAVVAQAATGPSDDALLMAPFSAQRANFLYAALGVPRMESAEIISEGETYVRLRTDHSASKLGDSPEKATVHDRFNAGLPIADSVRIRLNTWAGFDIAYGFSPWLELGARVACAGWDEIQDRFYIFGDNGEPLVRYEKSDIAGTGASKRADDISDAVVRAKAQVYRTDNRSETVSLACQAKLPLGLPRNLVDAGTTDLALSILSSTYVGPFAIHVNVAGMDPIGDQNLFVKDADVKLDPCISGGVSVMYRLLPTLAVGLQLEGNTSSFKDVPALDGTPVTLLAGVRKLWGDYLIEAGGGAGLDRTAYDYSWFLSAARSF